MSRPSSILSSVTAFVAAMPVTPVAMARRNVRPIMSAMWADGSAVAASIMMSMLFDTYAVDDPVAVAAISIRDPVAAAIQRMGERVVAQGRGDEGR